MPKSFMLRMNNNPANFVVIQDSRSINVAQIRTTISEWCAPEAAIANNFEYDRLKSKPMIIAHNIPESDITYGVICFNGKPDSVWVDSDRLSGKPKRDAYDLNWTRLPLVVGMPNSDSAIPRPDALCKMIEISKNLADGFALAKVNFIIRNGCIIFDLIEFSPGQGVARWDPPQANLHYGNKIELKDWANA